MMPLLPSARSLTVRSRLRTVAGACAVACTLALGACSSLSTAPTGIPGSVAGLRLIGEQRIPLRQSFDGTTVGGLSGIDYDRASGDWVLISDDRSAINPARYYRARLDYDLHGLRPVVLTGVTLLRQPDGTLYPSKEQFAKTGGEVPDLEAVRVDPRDGSIWYSSEGDRALGLDPFVRHARRDGTPIATLALPAMFRMSKQELGPRNNLSFEGIAFEPDGAALWVSMEAPLYQDGPVPTPDAGGVTRLTRYDRAGQVLGQFAYLLGPVGAVPGTGKASDNGVSEIVALGANRLLTLERSAVQASDGSYQVYVRIFQVDTSAATDIGDLPALRGARYRPVSKRLVLDLNTLDLPTIDNLEGMSFGPVLANGHPSLVLISDDNFSKTQVTQLLLFEVIPE
jgi:hypothetical protein